MWINGIEVTGALVNMIADLKNRDGVDWFNTFDCCLGKPDCENALKAILLTEQMMIAGF